MENNQLSDKQEILSDIPGAQNHDGGRIAFGPDDLLYITTGDASQAGLAQDLDSLAGKILRLNPDGTIPTDNPFSSPVYSYGHRNPQGLAWGADGRLWASEHGPSGRDEINLIEVGNNYGWPVITGDETQEEMISPVIHSGIDDTWAPSAVEIINNTLLFAGLRGSALYTAQISGDDLLNLERNFPDEYGRMRVVRFDGQDWIYAATNNRDGRGRLRTNDDKIIRFKPSVLGL
jgi:glucose/arabinose dehydrogenase